MSIRAIPEVLARGAVVIGDPDTIYTCDTCDTQIEGELKHVPENWSVWVLTGLTLHFCSRDCERGFESGTNATVEDLWR